MKNTLSAIAISLTIATTTATAGGLAAPEMEPAVIVEEASASSSGFLVPLLLLLLLAAAVSRGGGSTPQPSDARLKTDINQIGVSASGLPIYSFRYVGGSVTYQGAMAQDVLQRTPEAVTIGPFGYMMVDYDMIDVQMKTIN